MKTIYQLKKKEKLERVYSAFQRASLDLDKGQTPDPLKYCDYNYELQVTLKNIVNDLEHKEYRPKRCDSFDLPKGEYALRPGLIIDPLDLTAINALLESFIVDLDKQLPAGVTAYRLREDKKMKFKVDREQVYFVLSRKKRAKIKIEESWYDLWPKFKKELINDIKSKKFSHVAKTDITGFFEGINLFTLSEILKRKIRSNLKTISIDINLIFEIYRSWTYRDPTGIRHIRGLPQGSNTSGILSNFYLDALDQYLEQERKKGRIKWYRYCDDIYVLCKSSRRAKIVLLKIGSYLRNLGLHQNSSKTKVLDMQQALNELDNDLATRASEIIDDLKDKKKSTSALKKFVSECKRFCRRKKLDKYSEMALFRFYGVACGLDEPVFHSRFKKDFLQFPVRAEKACRYARKFINDKKVLKDTMDLLAPARRTILLNYQLSFLVTVFLGLSKADAVILKSVNDVVQDKMRHWYVRCMAISTYSFIGINSISKTEVLNLLSIKNHSKIRRSGIILLPLVFGKQDLLVHLDRLCRDMDNNVSRMANFCWNLIYSDEFWKDQWNKFKGLNQDFLSAQLWRLYYLSCTDNANHKKQLNKLMEKVKKNFPTSKLLIAHADRVTNYS